MVEELKDRYRKGKVSDVEVKERLFEALDSFISPIRERRAKLEKKPDYVLKILKKGTQKGREIAQETISKVRKAIGIEYFK